MKRGTEKHSLKTAVPAFSKQKERLFIILALIFIILNFPCTVVSSKNIFTHLITLVCISSHNNVTILTF